MRKYQQLLLLLLSGISIIALLVYKSENNRLKYILQVINFFGRQDADLVMRIENGTKDEDFNDFAYPLPVWQEIGEGFHAYSSFWVKNELIASGQSITLVVGKRSAIINFKCALQYNDGKIINGKFRFNHLNESETFRDNIDFLSYKFLCKTTRDFGEPDKVIYTDISLKTSYQLLLRHVKPRVPKKIQQATICLNLVGFNRKDSFSSNSNVLQFFFYHQSAGINHFFVYNGDALSYKIRNVFRNSALNLNYFPFNFPFVQNDTLRIRRIIEADCLMRNTNGAKLTFVFNINEFFYPNKIGKASSAVLPVNNYASDIYRFELPTYNVCLDHKNKLLIDNVWYDPELTSDHKLYAYKPTIQFENTKITALSVSLAMTHRYVDCFNVKDGFYDWRDALRPDFKKTLDAMRNEINFLF